ncbi:MAG: tetratricopeptide repeat protein [Gammaproteobacteria bacterium]|nr:tetratricopeptide repeat protein [Gammaproteobacteria bacterium]
MKRSLLISSLSIIFVSLVVACMGGGGKVARKDSIASLNRKTVEVKEPEIDDSLEKAMGAYRKFLSETAEESEVTPEAIRRLADLQLEAGAGTYDFVKDAKKKPAQDRAAAARVKQESIDPAKFGKSSVTSPILDGRDKTEKETPAESSALFEKRATQISDLKPSSASTAALPGSDTEKEAVVNANTDEAIALYKKLLQKYPLYDRNDQVMYQLARAYEDGGRQDEAKAVLDELVVKYPRSIHNDEAQFRRGEIFFVRRQYHQAEKAYSEVVQRGSASAFFDQALFKRGWCLFKQSRYEEALDDYVRLLDAKTAAGYHIQTESNKTEYQRVEDTFRVVSLSFSYLGGPAAIKKYFKRIGAREYEYLVYTHLGEHYLEKRRYQDAADAYNTFLKLYPLHEKAPSFHMQTIEIFRKGQFPQLVIEAKREFAITYDLKGTYWSYHNINQFPDVLAFVKTNLNDLAKHYHAGSQQARKRSEREQAYKEAARWYRTFLGSFPDDQQAPELNFLLAELLFDNQAYLDAAKEYERTAYAYPVHPKSAESGYAAVLAFREHEKQAPSREKAGIHQEAIRSSLQFAETYPAHPEAPAVLAAAAESLYELKEYERATAAAQNVIRNHPKAKQNYITAAWVVIAHSSFDLNRYDQAEQAYSKVLELLPKRDARTQPITDKLAASIYKQAEERQQAGDNEAAIKNFMRVATAAPDSPIRESAEFDAATVLISMEAWDRASNVLLGFRRNFPQSNRQFEVTSKLAVVYQKSGQTIESAREYERVSGSTQDVELKKEALLKSAELYAQAKDFPSAIKIYRNYIRDYPNPVEPAMEARNELAQLYKATNDSRNYTAIQNEMITVDRKAGSQRTDRTRYLAANALFVLTEPVLKDFKDARLGEPFKKTLANKKRLMQKALDAYGKVAEYEIAEMTAATTFQIADIYYEFSVDLLASERPKKLNEVELAEYDMLLEEQAYPFEEKAINVHEKNIELMTTGVFNKWITRSLGSLAKLVPARYAKTEQEELFFASIY